MLVADVSRGDGADFSVFHIFKLETMEIIAEYQGKVTPDLFSDIVFNAGREYGNAMIVVENNSVGFAVLDKLIDRAYPNIYHSIKSTHEYIDQYQAEHWLIMVRIDCQNVLLFGLMHRIANHLTLIPPAIGPYLH